MKAIIVQEKGKEPQVAEIDKPVPKEDQVLVKVKAVALNPVDWKMAKLGVLVDKYPALLGGDVAGIVESVGPNVTKYKPGDEIYGFIRLGTGAFAEYALLNHDISAVKPANISFEQAATFPVGTWTAALAVFDGLRLPLPSKVEKSDQPKYLLVWGGASSVGSYAVQLGKLAGCTVIATCSPKNFEYVRSLGASHTLDYRSPDIVEQIRKVTGGKLRLAVDAVSTETADQCAQAMATATSEGERPTVAVVSGDTEELAKRHTGVKFSNVLFGAVFDMPDIFITVVRIIGELSPLVENKYLLPNPIEVVPRGLAGIPDGLKRLESGVSGIKLVALID